MATKLNDFEVEFEKRLQVVKEDLSDGKVQMNYQDQIDVKGGVPPYKWELLEGRLPDGLTLDSLTGRITGIPTASGKQVFVVRAYDSSNDVARGFVIRSFVLKVE
jgi:hypothetical protein